MTGDGQRYGRPEGEPDLRVSDRERDLVASELGDHFQAGRLDQAEFDERVTSALRARTRRDLARLLTDLPPGRPGPGAGGSASGGPASGGPASGGAAEPIAAGRPGGWPRRLPVLVPLLLTAVLVVSLAAHGGPWHGGSWQGGSWHAGSWHPGSWHPGSWRAGASRWGAPWPLLWLIIPVMVFRARRGGRRAAQARYPGRGPGGPGGRSQR